ncbi:MAG TPA: hypothetical protein PKK69_11290, partial [Ferruginibacter sp.]|nr:hypothetical protein [Ferruginibacter sp.]
MAESLSGVPLQPFFNLILEAYMDTNNQPLPEQPTLDINADADIPGKTHLNNPDAESGMEKISQELEEQKDKY